MPSTYAHYRFGQSVYELLSDPEKTIIAGSRQLFDIGLHGPDILFYYKPFHSNAINRIGYAMHERSGQSIFREAGEVVLTQENRAPYLAYLYGFLCHFALDSFCHGYIDDKIHLSGISHTEIEVEFDRALMVRDGCDPVRHKLTSHIVPSQQSAAVISKFFAGTAESEVQEALRSMIFYNDLLVAPSPVKRGLICAVLACTGNYANMRGLLVNYRPNPACRDSCERLETLFDAAKEYAVQVIPSYARIVRGEAEFDERFRLTFGGRIAE